MYDLKAVIETNTKEGVIDFTAVMATLDSDYVNPIVAKKTDKDKLLSEAVADVVSQLGIEANSVDDVKLYIKKMGGSTDEVKEENIKISKELENLKTEYDKEVESRIKIEKDNKDKSQLALVKGLGIEDEEQVNFLKWKFTNQVTDEKTFDQVVAEYAKTNEITTTTKIIKDKFGPQGDGKSLDIGAEWKAQRERTRKTK